MTTGAPSRGRLARIAREAAIVALATAASLGVLAGLVLRRGPTLVALGVVAIAALYARMPLTPEDGWWRARMRHRLLGSLSGRGWLPVVHEDGYGALHRSNVRWWREQLAVVEVANHTPDEAGRFPTYVLRVPPHVATARAAVAWTFGLDEQGYDPMDES